jgi:adenylyltransferase/sulfurtransferase
VGRITLIDRDTVELSNLQRQTLFDEADAKEGKPKAVAAADRLKTINSEIAYDPIVADLTSGNIESALFGSDVVLDGSDNMEVRQLVNEWCVKNEVPWVYGAALQSEGCTMTFIPHKTLCFRCLYPILGIAAPQTCSSAGVLGGVTGLIGNIEATEAQKLLVGDIASVNTRLLIADLWQNSIDYVEVEKDNLCPVCGKGDFALLNSPPSRYAAYLCGKDAAQVFPGKTIKLDLHEIAVKLSKAGKAEANNFMLRFSDGEASFQLFRDGRAIIQGVTDEKTAMSVYNEYIGL